MKKITIFLTFLFILSSCGTSNEIDNTAKVNDTGNICNSPYQLGSIDTSSLILKGVVVADDIKTISSPMAGVVDALNCNAGKVVTSNTLIAKISPDFNNPSIINLSIQKSSLVNQKINLESIKSSTILNFDNQISDLKEQIIITEKNIELTKKSSGLSKNDLEKQISSLQATLDSLEANLVLSKKSKTEALEKIDISRESLFTNMKSLSSDNLLKIDEIFGITTANRDLNDSYESYLSAKNTVLLSQVKSDFLQLNSLYENINNLTDGEISTFLGDIVALDELARNAVKESIANVSFSQTQIDGLYLLFLNYSNNLSEIKSGWDNLDNSKSSTITTFDTQIVSLENQINTTVTSLENLKTNKLDSVEVGLDIQLSNFNSGLKTLHTNLSNLLSTKDSQILSLDNQILQIQQSIDSLNTNLSSRNIYANTSGIIKQKVSSTGNNVGINTPICQISPDNKSTKIKIYSPVELSKGDKLIFDFNKNSYEVQIENVLVYKDPITQNYIYESNYLKENNIKDGEILSLSIESISEENISDIQNQEEQITKVPVSYIKNKINGNYLLVNNGTKIIETKVELGDINGSFVEINNGVENISEICK